MDQKQFEKIVDEQNPKTPLLVNMLKAFLVGGIICTIGQLITFFYMRFFPLQKKQLLVQRLQLWCLSL